MHESFPIALHRISNRRAEAGDTFDDYYSTLGADASVQAEAEAAADMAAKLLAASATQQPGARRSPVAVLQLATRDEIFLLDLPALSVRRFSEFSPPGQICRDHSSCPPREMHLLDSAACLVIKSPRFSPFAPQVACPDALSAALALPLSSPSVPKLGFGVAADVAKAAASYPGVAAFREVAGILDLRSLWQARVSP